jgi:hypothetical protein
MKPLSKGASLPSLEELKRIAMAASDSILGPSDTWEVLPLEGTYYGTEVGIGDYNIIRLWGDSRNHDPSHREMATWQPGDTRQDMICDSHYETVADLATAEHIAAFNPAVVLALLDEIERQRSLLERAKHIIEPPTRPLPTLRACWLADLEKGPKE